MQAKISTNNGNTQAARITGRDQAGRPRHIQVDGHVVEINRLDHTDLILANCHTTGGAICESNARGICPHVLGAIFEAARDAGTCVTTCLTVDGAELIAREVGGKVLMARSEQTHNGAGMLWIVAGNGKRS